VATDGSVKAVVTAMFANLGIAVTKFIASVDSVVFDAR
jgi:hypothetical protein